MQLSDATEVDAHGGTHIGNVRDENQDQFLIAELHKVIEIRQSGLSDRYEQRLDSGAKALLLMVADGVGGTAGGAEASALTLDGIVDYVTRSMRCFYKLDQLLHSELQQELAEAVQRTHGFVRAASEADTKRSHMASTLTLAHVLWTRA